MRRVFKFLVSVVLLSTFLASMITTVSARQVCVSEEYYQSSIDVILKNEETIYDDVMKAYYHLISDSDLNLDSDLNISDGSKSEDTDDGIDLSNLFCVYSLAGGDKEWFYDQNSTKDTIFSYIDYEKTEWIYEHVIGDWIVVLSYKVSQDGELSGTGTYSARELEKGLTKEVINETLGGYVKNDFIFYSLSADYAAIIFDESGKAFGFGDLWGTKGYAVFDFDEVKANAIKNTEKSNLSVQEAGEPLYDFNLIDTSKMQTIDDEVTAQLIREYVPAAVVLAAAIVVLIVSGKKLNMF